MIQAPHGNQDHNFTAYNTEKGVCYEAINHINAGEELLVLFQEDKLGVYTRINGFANGTLLFVIIQKYAVEEVGLKQGAKETSLEKSLYQFSSNIHIFYCFITILKRMSQVYVYTILFELIESLLIL